ncbi:hypothetical protein PMIN06_003854 [Paraphaeosphaeria minitans]
MASLIPPGTNIYAKNWRRLNKIINRERETYELVTTNMTNMDPHLCPELVAPPNTTLGATGRAIRTEGTRRPSGKEPEQQQPANTGSISTTDSPITDFLARGGCLGKVKRVLLRLF